MILFFTNKGKVYSQFAYEIPEGSRTAKGQAIINLLHLEEGEKVNAVFPVQEYDAESCLTFATKKGMIKRTLVSEYENIRKNGIVAIKLVDDDELISFRRYHAFLYSNLLLL